MLRLALYLPVLALLSCATEPPRRISPRNDPSNPQAPEAPVPALSTVLTEQEAPVSSKEGPPASGHQHSHGAAMQPPKEPGPADGGAAKARDSSGQADHTMHEGMQMEHGGMRMPQTQGAADGGRP